MFNFFNTYTIKLKIYNIAYYKKIILIYFHIKLLIIFLTIYLIEKFRLKLSHKKILLK